MIRSILRALVSFLPKRQIMRETNDVYLERYYLCGNVGGLNYFPEGDDQPRWWQKLLTWLPCIYVHRFARSDMDVELHNHPWEATSLIVAGGYVEERRVVAGLAPQDSVLEKYGVPRAHAYTTEKRTIKPGRLNRIKCDTFHKVTLIDDDCWSIIVIGKKVQGWGFWHPQTYEFITWREHVARRQARVNARAGAKA